MGGDLGDGRNGLYYELNDKVFRASESGRRFTLECVLYALERVSKSSETGFRIERSDVEFIRAEKSSSTDAVRHLRVMDMCQAQLYRTVGHLKSGGKSILNSLNKFGKGDSMRSFVLILCMFMTNVSLADQDISGVIVSVFRPLEMQSRRVTVARKVFIQSNRESAFPEKLVGQVLTVYRRHEVPAQVSMSARGERKELNSEPELKTPG